MKENFRKWLATCFLSKKGPILTDNTLHSFRCFPLLSYLPLICPLLSYPPIIILFLICSLLSYSPLYSISRWKPSQKLPASTKFNFLSNIPRRKKRHYCLSWGEWWETRREGRRILRLEDKVKRPEPYSLHSLLQIWISREGEGKGGLIHLVTQISTGMLAPVIRPRHLLNLSCIFRSGGRLSSKKFPQFCNQLIAKHCIVLL